ncbi:fumarylacetoacetate hydrolase family protein [Tistrella mobilis]|uniref:Fumarylacetoacetat hydroxylase n=1 Tax=Tistrella mobilis (strain KA081020-065) TaxID=1110502 RepID=I3TWY1_TISMK|nr:fumarylacetoacetate hydrolase family protein [Tistrella mobilis]AFK57269.1 fumarylacetoacetat hydroxylase [Tistrella mobilis KA081020-065]
MTTAATSPEITAGGTAPTVIVPVEGGGGFAVRRVFCVGRNYAAHAREMGRDPDREPPFFFTKWAESVVPGSGAITYPPRTANYHHEVELVVAIAEGGANIPQDRALDHVFGYAVGLDMTRRDLQLAARDLGRPWDEGKNVEQSCPMAALVPAARIGHPERGRIVLTVDGAVRQEADLADLIWSVPEIVSILSESWTLQPGDLIFTGTPAGVGAVVPGAVMHAEIDGLPALDLTVVKAS